MPGGLVALLDDVAAIARMAAASLDDVGVAATKAASKAAGVVIDDAAVTPNYVTGFTPDRELPIIAKITRGSLFNKLVILLPAALLLSAFVPWAITPLLMLGGSYLSYEGAEKVIEKLGGAKHGETLEDEIDDPVAFEHARVAGAVRTDLILSAEIMAITLAAVAAESLLARAAVLALVGVAMTVLVYGAVGLIVKMDDIGLHLARRGTRSGERIGCALVQGMPHVLAGLSAIGTVAMLWVGGGIVLHGLDTLGVPGPEHMAEAMRHAVEAATGALGGVFGWATYAACAAAFGLVLGAVIALLLHQVHRLRGTH
ncbi:MAG: DUF808 domain-containing protein [Tsuneonella sp.]